MARINVGGSGGGGGGPGPPGVPGIGATFVATAGEALSADKLVYMAADGKVYLASATTVPQDTLVGFTQSSALVNAAVTVVISGAIPIGGGLVAGSRYYLGAAGGVTTAPIGPGVSHLVGVAQSATVLVARLGTSIELV